MAHEIKNINILVQYMVLTGKVYCFHEVSCNSLFNFLYKKYKLYLLSSRIPTVLTSISIFWGILGILILRESYLDMIKSFCKHMHSNGYVLSRRKAKYYTVYCLSHKEKPLATNMSNVGGNYIYTLNNCLY